MDIHPAPEPGDVVAYMRSMQDPKGEETENLSRAGITAFWAEESLIGEQSKVGDELARAFVDSWFVVADTDISLYDGTSLGQIFSHSLFKGADPFLFIRHGEIFRIIIGTYRTASEVVSDVEDGIPDYTRGVGYPFYGRLMTEISRQHGITLRLISSPAPLPSTSTQATSKQCWYHVISFLLLQPCPGLLVALIRQPGHSKLSNATARPGSTRGVGAFERSTSGAGYPRIA